MNPSTLPIKHTFSAQKSGADTMWQILTPAQIEKFGLHCRRFFRRGLIVERIEKNIVSIISTQTFVERTSLFVVSMPKKDKMFALKIFPYPFTDALRTGPKLTAKQIAAIPEREIPVHQVLQRLILLNGVSPCYTYLWHCETIPVTALKTRDDGPISRVVNRIKNAVELGTAVDRVTFACSEMCNLTFEQFAKNNAAIGTDFHYSLIDEMMFCIFYTIFVTARAIPTYRHGDLHPRNIMIANGAAQVPQDQLQGRPPVIHWRAMGRDWYVPYRGYMAKIIDFGFASISASGKPTWIYHGLSSHFEAISIEERGRDALYLLASLAEVPWLAGWLKYRFVPSNADDTNAESFLTHCFYHYEKLPEGAKIIGRFHEDGIGGWKDA